MKTYQDLQAVGQSEEARMSFILTAINEHRAAKEVTYAHDAFLYYYGENPTINRYEKLVYDFKGKAQRDIWSPNHKIASHFFGMVVKQLSNYLLANGVSFQQDTTKEKLGRNFDEQMVDAATYAQICGVSFCFLNYDHVEVFKLTEFVPLYDEETGALMAGIRYWQVGDPSEGRPLRATLYEVDGFTDYIQRKSQPIETLNKKRKYMLVSQQSTADGLQIVDGWNYPGFPIVPMKNNERCKSELVGRRNTVDALDVASSQLVNNTDEGNLIYWVLKNCGGMEDMDDAQFLQQLRQLKVVHVDGDAGVDAEPHTIEAPFAGTQATIDTIRKQLYEDFQAFDSAAVTASNQSATAIRASYVPLDLKADDFERQVTRCINGLLALAGIDDKPSYTRNQIVNKSEEVQTIMMAAEMLGQEYTVRKVLTILGDADQLDEVLESLDRNDMERFGTESKKQEEKQNGESQEEAIA